ncbi:MAG: hypothetical protein RL115_2372 [Bacteroidota bacterium]
MKKISNLVLLVASSALLLIGCKGKDNVANEPKAVIVAFFKRMAEKDIDGAAKLATKESKSTMDMMKKAIDAAEQMKETFKDSTVKTKTDGFNDVAFGDVKIDGDNATVSVNNKKKDQTVDFPLKKQNGRWKVEFTMTTLMKLGLNGMNKNAKNPFDKENGADSIDINQKNNLDKLFNTDSLKEGLDKAKKVLEKIKPEDVEKMKEVMQELEKLKSN